VPTTWQESRKSSWRKCHILVGFRLKLWKKFVTKLKDEEFVSGVHATKKSAKVCCKYNRHGTQQL